MVHSVPMRRSAVLTTSPSAQSGDIFACEDGGDLDICMITPEFEISRFLKLDPTVHSGPPSPNPVAGNETVGVVFDPFGRRMYFGAQRSFGVGGNNQVPAGVVYEISGPFRGLPDDNIDDGGADGPGAGNAITSDDPQGGGDSSGPLRVFAKRRRRVPQLLDRGLPITVEVGALAGLRAKLKVKRRRSSRKEQLTIARAASNVGVRGKVDLVLRTGPHAAQILAGREAAEALLEVVASYSGGRTDTVTKRVLLVR